MSFYMGLNIHIFYKYSVSKKFNYSSVKLKFFDLFFYKIIGK